MTIKTSLLQGEENSSPFATSTFQDDEFRDGSAPVAPRSLSRGGFDKSRSLSTGLGKIDDLVADALSNAIGEEFSKNQLPDMWSWGYLGLYSQYAAIGLLYGTSGALLPLCFYVYEGPPNQCANAANITFFAWSFKIIFAIITDIYRPFGLRRRPWMIFGWTGSLILLLVLAFGADKLDSSSWLSVLLLIQFFAMFSDVPADGYSVELGKLEPPEKRGVILATGQMVRFTACIFAGIIQATLLNSPATNRPDCPIDFQNCWKYGLNINGYYGLLFALTFILVLPVFWLKETDPSTIPQHSLSHFLHEIWLTLKNLTTLYLLIFVIGARALSSLTNVANIYMQYEVIKLTNFQGGIDTITTYLSLATAIWFFKTYLINKNWRTTQYGSTLFSLTLGFLWMLVYFDVGGLRDPWFTIFIDLDQSFVSGITQVLFSLAVIELSKPGLEATTYELIITVANAAATVSSIISTQLLSPLNVAVCDNDPSVTASNVTTIAYNGSVPYNITTLVYNNVTACPSNTVDVFDASTFEATNGPHKYAIYCVTITVISAAACLTFVRFLPASKEQCQEWKEEGEKLGESSGRAYLALFLCVFTIAYGFTVAVLLLTPATSCLQVVGGSGC